MSTELKLEKGAEVFRRHDPGRCGHLTGRNRSRGGDVYHQVQFQDGSSDYVPEYELEVVETEHNDPFWLIEQGRFGRVSDLRRNLSLVRCCAAGSDPTPGARSRRLETPRRS